MVAREPCASMVVEEPLTDMVALPMVRVMAPVVFAAETAGIIVIIRQRATKRAPKRFASFIV